MTGERDTREAARREPGARGGIAGEHGYARLVERVARLARERAAVVTHFTFGASVEGEPLRALTVAHPGARRPGVLVVANLHAMEQVGAWTALALAERAARGEGGWAGRRLTVVPVANPDGFLRAEAARAAGRRSFVRANARGVDLNRNFAENWDAGYYLHRLLPSVFAPGPWPLSEPETRALDELCGDERPEIVVSLHAFGEWIYLPWAGRREPPPDRDRLFGIARAMVARQPRRRYRIAQLAHRSRLFSARGAEIDHFYARHGALSFLVEIGPGPTPGRPSTWFDPFRWYTPEPGRLEAEIENVLPALDALCDPGTSPASHGNP